MIHLTQPILSTEYNKNTSSGKIDLVTNKTNNDEQKEMFHWQNSSIFTYYLNIEYVIQIL